MPPGVVTVTSTVLLAVPAGLVAVIALSLTTVKLVAAVVPKCTTVAPERLVPVIVTGVPPAAGRCRDQARDRRRAAGAATVSVKDWVAELTLLVAVIVSG